MIELKGNMHNHVVSILVDPRTNLNYINPKIVKMCHLKTSIFKNPRLVQLGTREKIRVTKKVDKFPIKIVRQLINANMNVIPLRSYGIFIGMDWLEGHSYLVNCKDKTYKIETNYHFLAR